MAAGLEAVAPGCTWPISQVSNNSAERDGPLPGANPCSSTTGKGGAATPEAGGSDDGSDDDDADGGFDLLAGLDEF